MNGSVWAFDDLECVAVVIAQREIDTTRKSSKRVRLVTGLQDRYP